eukprot:1194981-Prymnesium_polylepis.1
MVVVHCFASKKGTPGGEARGAAMFTGGGCTEPDSSAFSTRLIRILVTPEGTCADSSSWSSASPSVSTSSPSE